MSNSFVLTEPAQQTLLIALREVWKNQPESRSRVESLVQELKWTSEVHVCINDAEEPICILCHGEYAGDRYIARFGYPTYATHLFTEEVK